MASYIQTDQQPPALEIELTREEVQHLLLGVHVTVRIEDGGAVQSVTLTTEQ
jgi:hypothetical protein